MEGKNGGAMMRPWSPPLERREKACFLMVRSLVAFAVLVGSLALEVFVGGPALAGLLAFGGTDLGRVALRGRGVVGLAFAATPALAGASARPGTSSTAGEEGMTTTGSSGEKLEALLHKAAGALVDFRKGDAKAARTAEKALEEAVAMAPNDPRVLTYQGSLLILKGREAKLPFRKMQLVNAGLEKMDRAVKLAPKSVDARLQRAMHCLGLPAIFQRADTAVADFSYLLALAESQPGTLSDKMRAGIGLKLADAYLLCHRQGDALRALRQVAETFPGSEEAREASRRLDELEKKERY